MEIHIMTVARFLKHSGPPELSSDITQNTFFFKPRSMEIHSKTLDNLKRKFSLHSSPHSWNCVAEYTEDTGLDMIVDHDYTHRSRSTKVFR